MEAARRSRFRGPRAKVKAETLGTSRLHLYGFITARAWRCFIAYSGWLSFIFCGKFVLSLAEMNSAAYFMPRVAPKSTSAECVQKYVRREANTCAWVTKRETLVSSHNARCACRNILELWNSEEGGRDADYARGY